MKVHNTNENKNLINFIGITKEEFNNKRKLYENDKKAN